MSDPTNSSVDPGASTDAHEPHEQAIRQPSALVSRVTRAEFSVASPDVAVLKPKKTSSRVSRPRTQDRATAATAQETAEADSFQTQKHHAFGHDFLHRAGENAPFFTLEQADTITSIPADTSYPCTIRSDTDVDLCTEPKCFLTFLVDLHISHLLITIAVPDTREGYTGQLQKKMTLRFPSTAFAEQIQIAPVDSKVHHQADSTLDCYDLTLTYHLDELSTENVLVADPLSPVAALAKHLQQAPKIKCHVCGHGARGAIRQNLQALQDAFTRDGETHPLRKWAHPDKKGKFIIQHSEFIPPELRPSHYNLNAKCSFFSWQEYITIMAIADLEEHEHSQATVTPYEAGTQPMYVMSMAGGAERIYLGLLDVPTDDRVRLQPGDGMLVMHPDTEDRETALFGRVSTPLPGIPVSFLTIYLHMQWLKDEGRFTSGPFDFPDVISLDAQADRRITRGSVCAHAATPVKLHIQNSDRAYRHRVVGLAELNRLVVSSTRTSDPSRLEALLLGNRPAQVERRNIFDAIKAEVPDPRRVMGELNAEQEMVYALALAAPAGFVIVHGPPGTGKTYIGSELVKPFVMAAKDRLSVLCCSASNQSVNAFAVCLHNLVCKDGPTGTYVVRVHSYDTEFDIAKQPAISKRAPPDDLRPQLVQNLGDEEAETLKSMKLATTIHRSYTAQHKKIIEHVRDDRVSQESLHLAVGMRILQLIGELPAGRGDPTPSRDFAQLHENYRQFSDGVEFDEEKSIEFRRLLKEAREYVLAHAAVICTTPALACDAKVYGPCQNQVQLIVIDEAARSTEPELLPLFAFYHFAVGKVLLGDPRQLPPLALASITNTLFQSQLIFSLQDRLMKGGIPSVMLTRQYRMVPDISRPVSNMSYGGRLIDDESVRWENRATARQLRAFNKERFQRERCVVYLDIHTTTQADEYDKHQTGTFELGGSKSRYNEAFVMVCINLAKELMDTFSDASVAILTAYNAQYRLYLQAKDELVASDSRYERLMIDKVDRAQGMQVDIGIVDFLVKNSAGFLKQASRNNVAVSRWRMGLYFVGTKKAIDNCQARSLQRLQSEIIRIGSRYEYKGPFESDFYRSGDTDLAADDGAVSECPGGAEATTGATTETTDWEGAEATTGTAGW